MEWFLKSIGYIELPSGEWQDKNGYEPPKSLRDAYDYEMGIFK